SPPQAGHVPRYGEDVDVLQARSVRPDRFLQRVARKSLGPFLAVEPFLFEHQLGNAVLKKRHAAVVGGPDQSENPHLTPIRVTAGLRSGNPQPCRPWQCLYFFPDPQGQGALRETLPQVAGSFGSIWAEPRRVCKGARRSPASLGIAIPS